MIDKINSYLYKKLDEGYSRHKKISSDISSMIVNTKNNQNISEDKYYDYQSSLETHMANLLKNVEKYNALTRTVSIRNKTYETVMRAR